MKNKHWIFLIRCVIILKNGGFMKKTLLVLLILCFIPFAFSLEVARSELESAGDSSITFDNYTGPHDIINTIEEIKAIGAGLGDIIREDKETMQTVGDAKYSVIHAVDSTVEKGLDADILVFGDGALIDHIDNVRRIIVGYLVAAYDYSEEDAETIAFFVTIYNAVYRGDIEYFSKNYKSVVVENLTATVAGLSKNYKDWAGNTQIVIPLSSLDGGLGSVDSGEISNDKVVDEVQKEPDRGLDERKDLVEMKEEEAEKAEEEAQIAQKKATESKQELEEEKDTLENLKEEAKKAEEEAKANPDDQEAQKKAEDTKDKVEVQEQVVEEKEGEIKDYQDEAKEKQDTADEKREDAQSDRVAIAEDQEDIIEDKIEDEILVVTYGLKLVNDTDMLSALVLIDTATGEVVKESSVNVIRNRVIYPEGKEYVALAGTTTDNAAIRLVKLDGVSMEILQQSEEQFAEESVLTKANDNYFAILKGSDGYYLGKYNSSITKIVESKVKVLPKTPITVTDKGILVNDEFGKVTLLDSETLEAVKN